MKKYTLLLLLLTSCSTLSPLSTSRSVKSLNTSNLTKGSDGIYRLTARSVDNKVKPGVPYKEQEKVTSVDIEPIKREIKVNIPSKVQAQINESPVTASTSEVVNAIPTSVTDNPLSAHPVRVNWSQLLFYYGMIVWLMLMSWIGWKYGKDYLKTLSNPFTLKPIKKKLIGRSIKIKESKKSKKRTK